MSDDIVKELRESRIALHSTAHKAADEIDKLREELDACDENIKKLCNEITSLRAENESLREALSYYAEEHYNGYNGNGACARAALKGTPK